MWTKLPLQVTLRVFKRQFRRGALPLTQRAISSSIADDNGTVLDADTDVSSNNSADEYNYLSGKMTIKDKFPNGHRLFVIHPKIRWGRNSPSALTTAEQQLEEAIALVKTLPYFSVAKAVIVGTDYSTATKRIWGSGRIEKLVEEKENCRATAVMINVAMLSPLQQVEMSKVFRTAVFDRYNITLLIFKLYAHTKDAWLQIELASIPYIRQRMKHLDTFHVDPEVLNIELPVFKKSNKFEVLRYREHEVRKKIKASIEEKRNAVVSSKHKSAAVSIAVVGYTNAGKSSLIKRLTGKDIYVEDRLFATLDTSAYFCRLPSGCLVYFADTIGFISDLPTYLFASFKATLSYVETADLLIVVEDASHPNCLAQRETVLETLLDLHIKDEVFDNIIFVANKIDRLPALPTNMSDVLFVSCLDGTGLPELIAHIDKKVTKIGGLVKRMLKVRPGSEALNYLIKKSFLIEDPIPCSDGNHLMCIFNMNEADFAKFAHHFNIRKKQL